MAPVERQIMVYFHTSSFALVSYIINDNSLKINFNKNVKIYKK